MSIVMNQILKVKNKKKTLNLKNNLKNNSSKFRLMVGTKSWAKKILNVH
jgi:hypothetical protein